MIWSRLKNMCCPKCAGVLQHSPAGKVYECTKSKCDFLITEERFNEVVNDLYQSRQRV